MTLTGTPRHRAYSTTDPVPVGLGNAIPQLLACWLAVDHRRMLLLSIKYQLVRCLLCVTVVLVRRDLSKDAELLVLRHENHVLRRQIALWGSRSRSVPLTWVLGALGQQA
jgi:hypothetical protein